MRHFQIFKSLHFQIIACLLPILSYGQEPVSTPNYPQTYFRNPLNIPIILAGNYGECRPGHFHSGIDIKTNGKENQPVYAAADGYISRIKMDKGGFGHALYITHPNGYTTLYAHLNNFVPSIQQYLRAQQYKEQQWDIDVTLSANQFPIKKGQQIAWSGNTGASTAPHLHFEIRNTETEHPLNPEQFGLPIVDTRPPVLHNLALYGMSRSIYEQDPQLIPLHQKGSSYTAASTLITNDSLTGIGVDVDDFMNGSDNTINFYRATLYLDNVPQEEITLDNIGYDETRYLHAYADYKTKEKDGNWIQCFFQIPGNHLDRIYHHLNNNKGVLHIADRQAHTLRIEIIDDRKNKSTLTCALQYSGNNPPPATCSQLFKANQPSTFTDPNVSFSLDEGVLYDDICFRFSKHADANSFSDHYKLQEAYVPAHRYFDLTIKPNTPIPFDLRSKVAMIYSDGKNEEGKAATNTGQGSYHASVRNFGTFWLAADTAAPVIKSLQKNGSDLSKATRISFLIKDGMTSVPHFKAEIDGRWVCMEQHNDLFFYTFDNHCPKGKHTMLVTVSDENDNSSTLSFNFTR